MRFCSTSVLTSLFIVVALLPLAVADLNSDKQALLDFAAAVPHRRNLSWSPTTPVCTSWLGVSCTANGTRVVSLRLPEVGLVGHIPPNTLEISPSEGICSQLDALRLLSVRSNLLGGNLSSEITSLPSLHYLYLQRNNFSGEISSSFSIQLNVLDLSFNSFSGNIPQTIRNLTQLTGLSLQNNTLSGSIPEIDLPGLKHLNLSYNHLNGSVPLSLRKFPNSSFMGNSHLCGQPLGDCSLILSPPSPSPTSSTPPLVPSNLSSKIVCFVLVARLLGSTAGGSMFMQLKWI